jgi:hypothetical protein
MNALTTQLKAPGGALNSFLMDGRAMMAPAKLSGKTSAAAQTVSRMKSLFLVDGGRCIGEPFL